MSQQKLAAFGVLAIICFFSAGRTPDVQTKQSNPGSDSPSHIPKFDADASLSCPDQPTKDPLRSQMSHAESQIPAAVFIPIQSMNPDELGLGKLLVASRSLSDPSFAKTVVLLVQYDSKSVVGLMINRRTNVPLSRVFKQLKAARDRLDPVYAGGPVDIPAVFALLRSQSAVEGAEHITGGVYLISAKSRFEDMLSKRPDPATFHVYLGYAGWTPEQLHQEVKLGAWFIFQGDTQTVFNADPDSLWLQMIRQTEWKMAGYALPGFERAVMLPSRFF